MGRGPGSNFWEQYSDNWNRVSPLAHAAVRIFFTNKCARSSTTLRIRAFQIWHIFSTRNLYVLFIYILDASTLKEDPTREEAWKCIVEFNYYGTCQSSLMTRLEGIRTRSDNSCRVWYAPVAFPTLYRLAPCAGSHSPSICLDRSVVTYLSNSSSTAAQLT